MPMRQSLVAPILISVALLSSCSSEPPTAPARVSFEKARRDLTGTQKVCLDGPESGPYAPPPLTQGERAKAEWDIAAADNIGDISPEQEWEIRASLGSEMGLAPSQVNGWRDIYRSRAEIARRKIKAAKQPTPEEVEAYRSRIQKEACADLAEVKRRFATASKDYAALEQREDRHRLLSTLTLIALMAAIGGIGYALVRAKHRKKADLDATLKNIALDGQVRIAEIYQSYLSDREWAEIEAARADGDLEALRGLVERAQARGPR